MKARATLKIIPFPKFSRFASYAIEDQAVVLRLLGQIARTGVAADCYAWDPPMVKRFAAQNIDLARDLNYLAGVVKSGESFIGGLKDAARIAIKGKGFAKESNYLLHVTVDDTNEVIADEKIKMIQAIVALEPAVETEASVPRTLRGTPFSYPNGILGPNGERWVPTHGLCPHSRAPRVMTAMDDYFESNRNLIESNGIRICTILFAVGANALCIEPLFYWPDARLPHHERAIEPDVLAKLPLQPENPAATRAMKTLRAGLTAVFMREGCAHVQIGKTYRYRESREPATYALLRALKAAIDPNGRVNPGNLGLD